MLVLGIGNVTQCNEACVFLDNEGKQDRIKANKERLDAIYTRATENIVFYDRMAKELTDIYEKKKAEAEKKYQYISDEEVQEASKQDRRKGFELSFRKDSVNEAYLRGWSKVFGLYDGVNYANDKKWEAYKLQKEAENALKQLK